MCAMSSPSMRYAPGKRRQQARASCGTASSCRSRCRPAPRASRRARARTSTPLPTTRAPYPNARSRTSSTSVDRGARARADTRTLASRPAPSGCPAESRSSAIVRPSVSTASMNAAPNSADTGSRRVNSGPTTQSRAMRNHEPDPADDAARPRPPWRSQASPRRSTSVATAADRHAERARFVVVERQQVDAPAHEPQRDAGDARSGSRPRAGRLARSSRSCPAART